MIELTNAHTHEYPKQSGVLTLRSAESMWSIGVVGDVKTVLDPMEKVTVSGTQADGSRINDYAFEVPLSICLKGAVPIMEYLIKHYAKQP